MRLVRLFIDAGVAGIHIDDQSTRYDKSVEFLRLQTTASKPDITPFTPPTSTGPPPLTTTSTGSTSYTSSISR